MHQAAKWLLTLLLVAIHRAMTKQDSAAVIDATPVVGEYSTTRLQYLTF